MLGAQRKLSWLVEPSWIAMLTFNLLLEAVGVPAKQAQLVRRDRGMQSEQRFNLNITSHHHPVANGSWRVT